MLEDEIARLTSLVADLTRERDLAVAHDRQPYPTAWAYEQACKSRAAWEARALAGEAELPAVRDAFLALQAQVADLTRERDRQAAVIAGTAYPTDATLTKEQAFHGWHVANRQREGWMARALAAEHRCAELEKLLEDANAQRG
jgi:hypothetical protein